MQCLYLSYTLGGIISPLLTRPFMTSQPRNHLHSNHMSSTESMFSNTTFTLDYIYNVTNDVMFVEETNTLNVTLNKETGETSDIYLAFILTSILTLSASIPYCIMLIDGGHKYDVKVRDTGTHNMSEHKRTSSKVKRYSVVILVCLVNLLYAATEDSLSDFLITFCLQQLEWDRTKSVLLLSLYWTASCVGGILAVFIIKPHRIVKMTFCACTIWILAFLGALLCSQFEFHDLIWMCIPLSGMFMVVIIPNIVSWTEIYVCNVSGKISSLIIMSTGAGIALNPPFIGYLMDTYSSICFLYVLSIESFLCTLCFIFAYSVLHCCDRNNDNVTPAGRSYSEEIIPMDVQRIPVNCGLMGDITCHITENGDGKIEMEVSDT